MSEPMLPQNTRTRENCALLLVAAAFLPFYLSCAIVLAAAVWVAASRERRASFFTLPMGALAGAGVLLTVVTPVFFRNWAGLGCGVWLALLCVCMLYIRPAAGPGLLRRSLDLACAMSVAAFAMAALQKLSNPARDAAGSTYNPNLYGFLIELAMLAALYRLVTSRQNRFFYIAVLLCNAAGLYLSNCRSAWAALLLGCIVVVLASTRHRRVVLGVLCGVVALAGVMFILPGFMPPVGDLSRLLHIRTGIWSRAIEDFLAHPVFGRGLLAFWQVSGKWSTPHAHNLVLDVLECGGVTGLVLTGLYLGRCLLDIARARRAGVLEAAFFFGARAMTAVHGITDMPIDGLETSLLFLLLLTLRPGPSWAGKTA